MEENKLDIGEAFDIMNTHLKVYVCVGWTIRSSPFDEDDILYLESDHIYHNVAVDVLLKLDQKYPICKLISFFVFFLHIEYSIPN